MRAVPIPVAIDTLGCGIVKVESKMRRCAAGAVVSAVHGSAKLLLWHPAAADAWLTGIPQTDVVEGAITAAAAAWVAVAVSVASIAYSVYMSRNMKTKTSAEAAETNTLTNNSFTSAENRVGQGRAVPILLGEMAVGSNVISLGIDTSNNSDWTESIG